LLGANGAGKTTGFRPFPASRSAEGHHRISGQPIQRMEADKIVRLGLSHVPEGASVSVPERARESDDGAYPRKIATPSPTIWSGFYGLIFRGCGAAQPAGRATVGGEAADAGDRARLDGTGRRSAARRAVARPVADPGEGDLHFIRRVNEEQGMSILLVSKTPRWRWRRRIMVMFWKSAASS